MRSISLLLCTVFFIPIVSLGQKETYHWVMNMKAHVDFNYNPPLFKNDSQINYFNGYTNSIPNNSISDRNGNLRFYTDGVTIWDFNNNIMQNGTGLKGNNCMDHPNSIIVPIDQLGYLYYVFTLSQSFTGPCVGNGNIIDSVIYYHIIDMRGNNGKGEVVSKNNRLNDFYSTMLGGVKHHNGVDTWVITRDIYNSQMVAWRVTPCGVQSPVRSRTFGYSPEWHSDPFKISPNGKFAAFEVYWDSIAYSNINTYTINRGYSPSAPNFGNYSVSILNFNDSSGNFTENMHHVYANGYSEDISFTQNSSSLYLFENTLGFEQIDLISKNISVFNQYLGVHSSSIAPTGELWLSRNAEGSWTNSSSTLSAVDNPDLLYPNSNFIDSIKVFRWSVPNELSFPGFISSYFKPGYVTSDTLDLQPFISGNLKACFRDTIKLSGTSKSPLVDSLVWIFEQNEDIILHKNGYNIQVLLHPGNYSLKLIAWQSCISDTLAEELVVSTTPNIAINLSAQDTIFTCEGTPVVLDAGPNYSYLWQDGNTNQTFVAQSIGLYSVTGTNACGSASDSVYLTFYDIQPPNVFSPNNDGKNDEFKISGYNTFTGKLTVVDRLGQCIYKSSNYNNGWKAENIPDGMYFYEFEFGTCKYQKGWVQILR